MADVGLVATDVVRGDGQGRVLLEMARRLVAEGHQVTVHAFRLDSDLRPLVRWRRVPSVPGPDLVRVAWFALVTSLRLRRARHDRVCLMGSCASAPRPYVYYAQFSHRAWRATWGASGKPALRHRVNSAVHAVVERPLARRAERLIACHPDLPKQLGVPDHRAVVVPNGVDADEFPAVTVEARAAARRSLGVPDDALVISLIGEYHTRRKGLEPLVEAVAATGHHIVAAGSGDQSRLRRLAEARGVGDRLHLVGFRDPREVLAAADVAAVPSFYEPFSLAAAEAAAAGVPLLLSTAAGAFPHLPSVPVTAPADVEALRASIDRLSSDARLRADLSTAGPEAAAALRWEIVAAQAAAAFLGETRRRVLLVTHDHRLSGGERNLADLAAALRDCLDVHAAVPGDGPLSSALEDLGVRVHRFGLNPALAAASRWELQRRPWRAIAHARSIVGTVQSLDAIVRATRPDVVLTCSQKAHLFLAPIARWRNRRHIWWVQDILEPSPLQRLVARVARGADVVACLSTATAAPFQGRGSRVSVVPPGVATELVLPEPRDDARRRLAGACDGPLIGIVGQLARWKGQDVFVRAAALIAEARPDAHFAVVGECLFPENEAGYAAELEALVDSLGLRDRLVMPGAIDPIHPVMAALDVLVHASRLPEPFGRVLVEAMAQGTPVVTTTIGSGPEVVPADAGAHVEPDDPAALAEAVLDVIARLDQCAPSARAAAAAYEPQIAGAAMARLVAEVCA